jgi:acyl-lipid omega-6 desaturase (Delta-12 desaturase)
MGSDFALPHVVDARALTKVLAGYREPSVGRSIVELVITVLPLMGLWLAMWASLQVGYWLCLLLALPTAGFLSRLFILQHDLGHGSLFRRRVVNDWVGRVVGVFTLTPYDFWRGEHAIHHAGSGNLDRRGIGDVDTKTVAEYRALDWQGQLAYRVYRNPVFMFGVAPIYFFWIGLRIPPSPAKGWTPWLSVMLTNLGIAVLYGGLIRLTGLGVFLMIQLPILIIMDSFGGWMFYIQHQFEHTSWEQDADWSHPEASLHGSSYYDLPPALRWLTANVGMHHIHHLSSRIPSYRLPKVLRDHPELVGIGRLTLLQSLGCARLVLWDEERKRLVSFREMRRNAAADKGGADAGGISRSELRS